MAFISWNLQRTGSLGVEALSSLFDTEPVDFVALQEYLPPGATTSSIMPNLPDYEFLAFSDEGAEPRPPSAALLLARRWSSSRISTFGNSRICGTVHSLPTGTTYVFISLHMPSQWQDPEGVEHQRVLDELSAYMVDGAGVHGRRCGGLQR
mmetsp:Transcript_102371/g.294733  ORF Transcript_102371/g.294733 Transcript_102371/m.294733 type:complete len:151 (-) Transcript_102371:218-670(-)